ncbi:hypothetical protein B0J15DRAFT_501639 [Fusarium solani]|uniref:Uncharacterized protein n=1 Tax=Fusarium solani TaxID=169388 RepID=A0A9P9GRR7_FUSSL|nr:uncharacterized protein B0J15DRAFT_501639 [Fusarium solani]KAH7242947.1 hypothetical protein B0J15DRAFT_501639 [Fusarium solani]
MNKQSERMPLQERLEATTSPPFYSVRVTKAHIAIYLNQYRLSQWLAASRGLLRSTTHMPSRPPRPEGFPRGHLEEDDEMVLSCLRKAQASLQTSLSRLDQDLQQLQKPLLSTRKQRAVRAGLITLFLSAFLSVFVALSRRGQMPSMYMVPCTLQPLVPLLPSPIAILLIANRERQIWAVAAARSRVEALRVILRSSQPVSPEDIAWLESEEWDGVNWGLVGL